MTVTLGANIAALQAQQKLDGSAGSMARTFERLSSGQRINRASDDAAGLAIAMSLNAGKRVLMQGVRNLNDGLSLLNIADAALAELSGVLTRIRELATQSANGIYGDHQRRALDTEAKSLEKEYNRILAATEFNGQAIFDGGRGPIRLQDGYGADGGLTIQLGSGTGEAGGSSSSAITLISKTSSGSAGDGASTSAAMSADGRFVAFTSEATNLVTGDNNGRADIFVYDRTTGSTTRVSVDSAGSEVDQGSNSPSISADGRYVAFASSANTLVAGDTNDKTDIFVHDRGTGVTTRVSVSSLGEEGNFESVTPRLSTDGRFVAFASFATNLTPDAVNPGIFNVFVHDRVTGETTLVSKSSDGVPGDLFSRSPNVLDGRYVIFQSLASNLVDDDPDGFVEDIFLHDLVTGETTLLSVNNLGGGSWGNSANPSVSANGRFLAFDSDSIDLVPGDTNGSSDIFVRDLVTGEISRVSIASSGSEANGGSFRPSISGDGRYVVFESDATNLVDGDTNGVTDLFLHDRETGKTVRISTTSMGGEANAASRLASISADGAYVVFQSTADNIVPSANGVANIFLVNLPLLFSGAGGGSSPAAPSPLILESVNISTAFAARGTMTVVDSQLSRVAIERGNIGKSQSRIEAALGKLQSQIIQMGAAEARITDADLAAESSEYLRLGILQQSASAILAQANQAPAVALRLLQ